MMEPAEIVDEEYEQILERVAAVDVAKATGMVCTRVPDDSRPGRRVSRVWEVAATTNAIIELGESLAGLGIQKVTLESTSVIWRANGMNRTLPRSCRRGRASDGKDKSGNDEGPSRHQLCGRLSAWQTVPG